MAAMSSAPLPAEWTGILEQIETALAMSLAQAPDPASFAAGAPAHASITEPELNPAWAQALETAAASATPSEQELVRAEQMLRDWLAAVQSSRARLEAAAFLRI
jgi:hypothetical protein